MWASPVKERQHQSETCMGVISIHLVTSSLSNIGKDSATYLQSSKLTKNEALNSIALQVFKKLEARKGGHCGLKFPLL